jgi:hypothetical protein
MENKDAILIRKMISLVESIDNKLEEEQTFNEETNPQEIEEQVTQATKAGVEFIGNLLKSEKGLFSTLRTEIPSLSRFKTADELANAIKGGQLNTAESFKIIKQANKVPEIALKLKGLVGESPTFKEIVKKVYPRGGAMPPNPENFKLASETLQKTYGMSKAEAEALLKKGSQEMGSAGGVSSKAVNQAIKRRTATTHTGKPKPIQPTPTPVPPKPIPPNFIIILIQFLKKKKTWKEILKWGIPLGLTAGALWLAIANSGETVPDDIPEKQPTDTTGWAPCVKDLLDNRKGEIVTSESGQVSVFVKTNEYPDGLNFYSNGRVMNNATGKMGSWSCKGSQATVQEDLNEEGTPNEITQGQMSNFVDTAVDDLDGLVTTSNLTSLKNILTQLKGKTYRGKNAISEFLRLYSADEGGDSFVEDVKSVGVKTLGVMAIDTKQDVLDLANQTSTTTDGGQSDGSSANIDNIIITWDGEGSGGGDNKKEGGSGGGEKTIKKKKSSYRTCTDFPFTFGCKSDTIARFQGCIGMLAKYQTGNFGPMTKKAIEDRGEDASQGITKELYDKYCTGEVTKAGEKKISDVIKDKITPKPSGTDFSKVPLPKSLGGGQQQPSTTQTVSEFSQLSGRELYDQLKKKDDLKSRGNSIVLKRTLDKDDLKKLDEYIGQSFGMNRTGVKKVTDRYGAKYIWEKP